MRVFIFGLVLVAVLCICETRKHGDRLEKGKKIGVSAPSANPYHRGRNYNKKERLRGKHLFTDLYHKKHVKKGRKGKLPRHKSECKTLKCEHKEFCIVHPTTEAEKCINKHDFREGRRLFRQYHKQKKFLKDQTQIKELEAQLMKGEHLKDVFDLMNHHLQSRKDRKRGRKHHKNHSVIEKKQDALFKEASEEQQCRSTELGELKKRMIGWFDMIHTESREAHHRTIGHQNPRKTISHLDKQSMYHHKREGNHLSKPDQVTNHRQAEHGNLDPSISHHNKQSVYHHKKGSLVEISSGPSHVDRQSMFHKKRGRMPIDHRQKQSMYHHKRDRKGGHHERSKRSTLDIVEKESHGGCVCSKSVMWEFRKQDTSVDGHLTEDEMIVMESNRREPCMKHLLKSCDTHQKMPNGVKLSRGEWCCCFEAIVAPCFEKKKHSNPEDWIPSCDKEGYFERQQCHKSGACWCVDMNGNYIEGTKTKQGKAECGKFGPSGYPVKP